MTLATHIVVGAAGAKLFATDPAQGFVIGWLSHYILDLIIHWDYPLSVTRSKRVEMPRGNFLRNREVLVDISKVITDVFLGFVLVHLFLRDPSRFLDLVLLAGAFGATVPDFLQFVFALWRARVLEILQRFHNFMHAKRDLDQRPILGASIQITLIAFIIYLVNL